MQVNDYADVIQSRQFSRGDFIFLEGDLPDSTMYCLLKGELTVCKNRNGNLTIINEVVEGEFFGEIGLIIEQPRLASIRVESEIAKVAVISKQHFYAIIQKRPGFLYLFLKNARERLFRAETKLVRLYEQSPSSQDIEFDVSKTRVHDWNILEYVNKISTKIHKKGEQILDETELQDGHLHFVINGLVRIERKRRDRFYEVNIMTPGELFGMIGIAGEENYALRITAASESCQTGSIEKQIFGKVCQINPELLYKVIKILLWRLQVTEDKIPHLLSTGAKE